MRMRIFNARILTELCDRFYDGEIWVRGSLIEYVGKQRESNEHFDKEIDAEGNLILPGFKNAHTHLAMTFARSKADDMPLDVWLNKVIFPLESRLTEKHIYWYTKLALMECISSGITAVCDMYYEPDAIVKASKEVGVRTVLCGAINNFKESPAILENYYQKFNNEGELISYVLGFHAEYTTDFKIIKEVGKLAEKYHAPVYVHNSETKQEVEGCIKRNGMTPTQLFKKGGIYDYGGGGYHCNYLSEDDIEYFKEKGLYVILNTGSNLKLASGIAPLGKYIEKNLNLALGTDGASSNNALDMFREMYLNSVIHKVVEEDPQIVSADKLIQMATKGGAEAMMLNQADVLQIGKKADLIILDMKQPNMQPINDLVKNIVYSGGKHNVKLTMVNGKVVYEDGEYKTVDQEEVYYYANKLLTEIN